MADKFAKDLVKKYLFSEDVYQTDVIFSATGDRMLINGADIGKDTKIYDYTTSKSFTSINPSLDTSLGSFTHDLSVGDNAAGFPFLQRQTLFEYRQGISDMYQFVLNLSNGIITFDNRITDASAVRLVDQSNTAIQAGSRSQNYKAGVYRFATELRNGALPGNDSSGGVDTSNSLSHEVTRASALLAKYPTTQIIQQFNRLFFNNDGTKLYALYRDKTKITQSSTQYYTSAIQTFSLSTPYSLNGITSSLSNDHVIVYDNSFSYQSNSTTPYTGGVMGLYSQAPDVHRKVMGFHISKNGDKIFFLTLRGSYGYLDPELDYWEDNLFFGSVECFNLPSAWDVSSGATYVSSAILYGGFSSAERTAKNVGIFPIDITFNHKGTKLHILGSEGTNQKLYTYTLGDDNNAYTLPSNGILENAIVTPIQKVALDSLTSVNNKSGLLVNLAGCGIAGAYYTQIKNACTGKGNTVKINTSTLSTDLINTITNKNTNVIEHKQATFKAKRDNYYKLVPDNSYILTDQGEVLISSLTRGRHTYTIQGVKFSFVGLISKEVVLGQGLSYAIVFEPSSTVTLTVRLNGSKKTQPILSQPLTTETQARLAAQGIILTPN